MLLPQAVKQKYGTSLEHFTSHLRSQLLQCQSSLGLATLIETDNNTHTAELLTQGKYK